MKYLLTILLFVSCKKIIIIECHDTQPSGLIYIDCASPTIYGTLWNSEIDSITVDDSGLSSDKIKSITDSVQKDFTPLNIKVTTSKSEYDAFKPDKRVRVVLTRSYSWYPVPAGGIAFIGSFGSENPAFVFTSLLGYNTNLIAGAVSHEAGHTLGNYHQSTWYEGKMISEFRNYAIMGNPYTRPNVWVEGTNSRGLYQNDTSVINKSINKRLLAQVQECKF